MSTPRNHTPGAALDPVQAIARAAGHDGAAGGSPSRQRVKIPTQRRWWLVVGRPDRLIEVDVVWCTARQWARYDWPGWITLAIGPFVIGLRATD